jgi:K+-sensing histidine kinase KdpD
LSGRRAKKPIHDGSQKNELNGYIHCNVLVLEDELEKIRLFYESLATDKKIKIYIIGNAHVFADPMLLRRTLSNLIANAIYYTNSGGKVGLLAKPGDHYTEVLVCDNGIGIDNFHKTVEFFLIHLQELKHYNVCNHSAHFFDFHHGSVF